MARVTIEDCLHGEMTHFDLVLLAAQRARQLAAGAPLTIERDNDKNPVIALREIAKQTISIENLHEDIIQRLQKHVQGEEVEEEFIELLSEEHAYAGDAQHQLEVAKLALDDEISEEEPLTMADEAAGEEE